MTNIEIKEHYKNEPKFTNVYPHDNLPNKIKDGAFDEYSDIGTHWIALYVRNNDAINFESFWVECIPKEIKTFIGSKNIKQIFLEYKHIIR